jgi:glucose/arabinose dehydrogenase
MLIDGSRMPEAVLKWTHGSRTVFRSGVMHVSFRTASFTLVGLAAISGLLLGQQSVPQPRADQLPSIGPARPNRGGNVPAPAGAMPTAPAGFTVTSYAELQAPRMMVFAPNGDLFVSSPTTNSITVLRDANQDGTFEAQGVFAQGTLPAARGGGGGARAGGAPPAIAPASTPVNPEVNGPLLGASAPPCTPPPPFHTPGPGTLGAPFGLAFNGGYLYVGNTTSLVRYRYTAGDLKAQGEPEKLLDFPAGGHTTRNVIFNRAGTKMYLAVGSSSNNSAGEDCRRAAILEFNPDGSGYRVFASGIRNPVGLALQPGTDIIWTAVNERDNLGDDLVPDYATSVRDGGFYGWPYSYIGPNYDPRYQGAFPDLVKRTIVPDVLLPAHAAALGVTFYSGTQFPQRYRNGGFVALHGSWNRSTASGYKVVYFPMTNGRPGPIEDFLTGFVVNDGSGGVGIQRWGRPVGVTVAPDGSLLVSDDAAHRIWRVRADR